MENSCCFDQLLSQTKPELAHVLVLHLRVSFKCKQHHYKKKYFFFFFHCTRRISRKYKGTFSQESSRYLVSLTFPIKVYKMLFEEKFSYLVNKNRLVCHQHKDAHYKKGRGKRFNTAKLCGNDYRFQGSAVTI